MKTIIKNGRIIDPKNNLDGQGDLVIEDGKISQVLLTGGSKGLAAEGKPGSIDSMAVHQAGYDAVKQAAGERDVRVIDAAGCIVAPGFVDLHIHEDPYNPEGDQLDKSIARSMLHMGVTTAIGGNCGLSLWEPAEYLSLLDQRGTAVNIGLFAGHGYLRERCGGADKYAPVSPQTMAQMEALGMRALEAGCFGVSFGLKYVPGADGKEVARLSSICDPKKHLVASHIRMDVDGVFDAALEMAQLNMKTGVPVQISHLGSMGGYGQMQQLLSTLEQWQAEGSDLAWDCYPYDAFSTTIGATTYDEGFLEDYQSGFDGILICDGKYAGMRCTEEIFRELRREAPQTTTVGYFMKKEDIERALCHPVTIVASDGLRNGAQGHPRAAGTFPRFLKEYVKTGKISLAEGLAKMTVMPASRLGLKQKGHLSPGADGDVTIFSLAEIEDKATYEEPALPPTGIRYVLIGGEMALENGKILSDSLGRAVRR